MTGPVRPGLPALALLEPDRPHNLGAALRLTACLGVELHVIEPCGFPLDDRRIRQSGLDYIAFARWSRHADFAAFEAAALRPPTPPEAGTEYAPRRLVLLTTCAETPYHRASYRADDVLVVGRESRGAPPWLHARADLAVRVPMRPGARSLNVVVAAALVLGEAMRQTGAFDRPAGREE